MTIPVPDFGAVEFIAQVDDDLWLFLKDLTGTGMEGEAIIVDLGQGTVIDVPELTEAALHHRWHARALVHNGNLLLFQAGDPIRVHRFNLASRQLDVIELQHSATVSSTSKR